MLSPVFWLAYLGLFALLWSLAKRLLFDSELWPRNRAVTERFEEAEEEGSYRTAA